MIAHFCVVYPLFLRATLSTFAMSPLSTFEWPLLKRFYRSEVKVEVDSETKYTFAAEASFRRCGVVGVESYLSTEYSRWRPRTGSRNNYTSRAENTILHHACITAW